MQRARLPQRLCWVVVLRVGRQTEGDDLSGFIESFTQSGNTLSIIYNRNTGLGRSVTINLTPTSADGTRGTVVPLTITQLAAPPTLSVATVPADLNLAEIPDSPAGTITATITLGATATGWEAAKIGDEDKAFIESFTASGDETNNRLTITYNANTGVEREVTINLTPTDADGAKGAVVPLTITQLGGPPTIDGISTDVTDNTSIPAEPTGPITATITLGGGATGWDGNEEWRPDPMRFY